MPFSTRRDSPLHGMGQATAWRHLPETLPPVIGWWKLLRFAISSTQRDDFPPSGGRSNLCSRLGFREAVLGQRLRDSMRGIGKRHDKYKPVARLVKL